MSAQANLTIPFLNPALAQSPPLIRESSPLPLAVTLTKNAPLNHEAHTQPSSFYQFHAFNYDMVE